MNGVVVNVHEVLGIAGMVCLKANIHSIFRHYTSYIERKKLKFGRKMRVVNKIADAVL